MLSSLHSREHLEWAKCSTECSQQPYTGSANRSPAVKGGKRGAKRDKKMRCSRNGLFRSARLVCCGRTRATIGLVSAVSLAGAVVAGAAEPEPSGWPMFRGQPTQTGIANTESPLDLKVRWRFEAQEAVGSSAAIVGDSVYVGDDMGFVYALDLSSGKLRWKHKAAEVIRSSPTVVDNTVVFGDDEGVLHALDAKSGIPKWSFPTEGQIVSSVNHDGENLVFGSYDGSVYCVSPKDGKLIWKHTTEGRVHGTPAIAEGHAIVAGCDEHLHVIELDTGKPARKVSMGSVSGASAAVVGSVAYVGTYGGSVLAIDWKAGGVVWRFKDPDHEFPVLSSAAVTDEAVIVGGRDKRLHALDRKTGKSLWEFVTKGRIDSSPVVVGLRVYIGSFDGNLYAVELATGREVWRFETGAPISASPAVAEGCLVIGTEDGIVYCFDSGDRASAGDTTGH